MSFLNKIFHLDTSKTTVKTEIVGGLITFIAMCYILPINTSILGSMGMNAAGIFATTALLAFFVTLLVGLVTNYPLVYAIGMGLNTYIAYTLSSSFPSWQQRMILMTVCGIVFLVLSLTPVRRIILEAVPKDLKCIISAALGAFIMFVGLKGAGIITSDPANFVGLGNFADPAVLIAVFAIFLTLGLMFVNNKTIKMMAIPLGILFAAIAGLVASIIMKETGALALEGGSWIYKFGKLDGVASSLPTAPWYNKLSWGLDVKALGEVTFLGAPAGNYSGAQFGKDLAKVFTSPISYVAIFSMLFLNLFNTAATLFAIGEKAGVLDEKGQIKNYRKAVFGDVVGSMISGPLGNSAAVCFVESDVGTSLGAKTGLSACIAALLFLLSAFIYPVFFVFTAGSVTASALVCVGISIIFGAMNGMDLKKPEIAFTGIITVVLSILCYSIAHGIGFGLIAYCIIMMVMGKRKEVRLPIYIIAALFVVSFIATTIVN